MLKSLKCLGIDSFGIKSEAMLINLASATSVYGIEDGNVNN